MENNNAELERLRQREAQIKRRIRELQSRSKTEERKRRTARLVRWGVVVESMLQSGEFNPTEWADICKRVLRKTSDLALALEGLGVASQSEAHLNVSQPSAEKQCAPAAGENQ